MTGGGSSASTDRRASVGGSADRATTTPGSSLLSSVDYLSSGGAGVGHQSAPSPPESRGERAMTKAGRRGNNEGSAPRRRPDGRWQINVWVTDAMGDSKRVTVYGANATETRAKAAQIRARVAEGQPAKDRKQTVTAYAQQWIDTSLEASDRKRTTKTLYAGVARTHILGSAIGRLTLDKIRPSHVEGWIVELRHEGLAESSIRSAYTILRAVLDTAVRDGALATKPAAAVRRPKVTSKEAPHLTPAQVAELLDAAQKSRYVALFELLAHTGLRRGEALSLRWADVDFDRGTLRVRGTLARIEGALVVTEPKTAKSKRVLPLSNSAERRAGRPGEGARAGRLCVAQHRLRVHHRDRRTSAIPATPSARSRPQPHEPASPRPACTPSGTQRPASCSPTACR